MSSSASIFLDVELPNATTWFYFSGLLAVALFFKFARLLSMRNWDVLTLFLLMPGFLLLLDAQNQGSPIWGYVWLLAASGYYLVRCLLDLVLVRRPALRPNLSLGGLIWMAGTLFVSLVAVAVRQPERPASKETAPTLAEKTRDVIQKRAQPDADEPDLRVWVERGLALLCHLSIVVALALIGWRHFDDLHGGVAAATFYLLLPYTFLLMPATTLGVGRWDHAWPMALMVWAVLAYRRPTLAGLFLGVAAGSLFFPVLTFPVWFSFYWRRGACRFTLSFLISAGLCLGIIGALLWVNGELPASLQSAWNQSDWQPWKQPNSTTPGFWRDIPRAYRLPVFLAYLALVTATAFWPSPKNLGHVLALTAAVLIGIQFWYADHGGVYVLWYLPFLLLLVFRPNLSACQPAPPGDDWLGRVSRRLGRGLLRALHLPQPTTRVA